MTLLGTTRRTLYEDNSNLIETLLNQRVHYEMDRQEARILLQNRRKDRVLRRSEMPEEVAKDVTPPQAESKTGLYILGGIGVLAAGYLYFIIRNPKAYVQGKAISTAGGLVSQALGAEHGS